MSNVNNKATSGATLASQFADPDRWYWDNVRIGDLADVAHLRPAERQLLERVDGVLANLPVDERVQLDELVRMERADVWTTLDDGERASVRKAWRLLEANPTVAPPVALAPERPEVSSQVVPPTRWPTTLDVNRGMRVSYFPRDAKLLARVQRLSDSDGDPNTVSVSDVRAALAARQAFLPQEVAALERIESLLVSSFTQVQKDVTVGNGTFAPVPTPGVQRTVLLSEGGVEVALVEQVRVFEDRVRALSGDAKSFTRELEVVQSRRLEITLPEGAEGLMVNAGGYHTERFPSGVSRPSWWFQGSQVLEVWRNGARVASHPVSLPPVAFERDLDGIPSQRSSFPLKISTAQVVSADGQPLKATPVQAVRYPDQAWVRFELGDGVERPNGLDAAVLEMLLSPPQLDLQPGWYDTGSVQRSTELLYTQQGQRLMDTSLSDVHVYSSGGLSVEVNGRRVHLEPYTDGTWRAEPLAIVAGMNTRLVYQNKMLRVEQLSPDGAAKAVLSAAVAAQVGA